MKKVFMLCLAVCFLVALSGSPSQAPLSSTFDSSAEGWTGNPGNQFFWDPSGYIGINGVATNGWFYFFPPSNWHGDGPNTLMVPLNLTSNGLGWLTL